MAQLEHAPRRTTALSTGMAALVGVAAAVAIAATILIGSLFAGSMSPPTTQQGQEYTQANQALDEAGREWQRQRELQGGFSDPLTQAGRDWEQQRKQQSPFDGE